MARCWTCGSEIPEFGFTCPVCTQTKEIVKIREKIESYTPLEVRLGIDLYEISEGFSEIASIIEWGFEDLSWRMEQMTGALKRINETLKTPSQTQANEWRQIAEELRRRDVLNESEKFFLKSLEANPLDYRTYIGLGKTYLQMEKLEESKLYFEKSLPHAPKGKIDYKSYSYRLIGRIYFCQEKYQEAALILKTAVELSPNYYLGHYDYAQYCALTGDRENCLSSLRIAIIKGHIPFELVRVETNLKLFRKEITNLLKEWRKEFGWYDLLVEEAHLDIKINIVELKEEQTRIESYFKERLRKKEEVNVIGKNSIMEFMLVPIASKAKNDLLMARLKEINPPSYILLKKRASEIYKKLVYQDIISSL